MTNMHPPQDANEQRTAAGPKPPRRWIPLAYTILPLVVYLVAECIPLPGIRAPIYGTSSPDTYNIVAVGILPWIIAALMIEVLAMIVPSWRHLRHDVVFGRAELRRATNIVGSIIAVAHASWIAFLLSFRPSMFDPANPEIHLDFFGPSPEASSPPLVFVTLVAGAIFVRLLAEIVTRRGLIHGYAMIFGAMLFFSMIRTILRMLQVPEAMDVL